MNFKWLMRRRKQRGPSEDTLSARRETAEAKRKLNAVRRDDATVNHQTARLERLAQQENDFIADIRRALGSFGR